jgi:acetyl esterase
MHGGAFMADDLDMPEAHMVSAELARRADATVVSVGYRLAVGGVRHPVPLEDVWAAWSWVHEQLAPGADVCLGGASAGATLAVGCAMLATARAPHRAAAHLLMAYPFMRHPLPAPSPAVAQDFATEMVPALRFSDDFIDTVVENYVGSTDDVPPLAVPGLAGPRDLVGLPAMLVATAEYDDLRPSAEQFARQVRDAGGAVELHTVPGMPHGFLNRTTYLPQVGATLDLLAARLRQPA